MKHHLFLIFILFNFTAYCQGVKVLNKADLDKLPIGQKFTFIEPSTDTTDFKYVATLQGKDRIRKENIEVLYYLIREKANKLGANCFKINHFIKDDVNGEVLLVLDAFYATDSLLTMNRSNHEKNVVYILGNENSDSKPISFNINNESVELKPGTYYKIQLKEGEEIKVSKGGMLGAFMILNFQQDKLATFYTLSGFGLSSIEQQPANGISFKSGGINRIGNISLGFLIIHLLKPCN